jgi:hypothetical protein
MKTLITLVAVMSILETGDLMAIEEAKYSVLHKEEAFEIRQYDASIVAEVVVNDSFEDASDKAFRRLFKYISGENVSRSSSEMTAPVSQTSQVEKIAMTAPVGQRAEGQGWAISFMMPSTYTLETIPVPENDSVTLREIPAYQAATIRYSGTWSEKKYNNHLVLLRDWIEKNGMKTMGQPVWARYNAPFTPWFMRRNEILIPVNLPGQQDTPGRLAGTPGS